MFDRELTQLISTAKYYLDAADAVRVPEYKLARTVSADAARWPADRLPHSLSSLDAFSAHLGSCAARLATIHEILAGSTPQAWAVAYPNDAELTDENVRLATTQGLEILLRDNMGHAEEPATRGLKRSKFRKAALSQLTFWEMRRCLGIRYQALADKMHRARRNREDG